MRWTIALILSLALAACECQAIVVNEARCYDDGHFLITLTNDEGGYEVHTDEITFQIVDENVNLPGYWFRKRSGVVEREQVTQECPCIMSFSDSYQESSATFQSEEMVLNGNGTYPLQILYSLTSLVADQNSKKYTKYGAISSYKIECPGLLFSCTSLGINIESCETSNGTFDALISIKGLEQSEKAALDVEKDIIYRFEAADRYKDVSGMSSKTGGLPVTHNLIREGVDKYRIIAAIGEGNFLLSLIVGYDTEKFVKVCSPDEYPSLILNTYAFCNFTTEAIEMPQEDLEENLSESFNFTVNESEWNIEQVKPVKKELLTPNETRGLSAQINQTQAKPPPRYQRHIVIIQGNIIQRTYLWGKFIFWLIYDTIMEEIVMKYQ